jgi:hypothetical protein
LGGAGGNGKSHRAAIDAVNSLGYLYLIQGRYAASEKLRTESLQTSRCTLGENDPSTVVATNNLPWFPATVPESSGLRDPARAVEPGKTAVAANPQVGNYWNTLGVAQCRARAWQAAFTALERSMELCKGGSNFDRLYLDMAHFQLGHRAQARQWYVKAVGAMEQGNSCDPKLLSFRAEAEAMMFDPVFLHDVFAP